MKKSCFEIGKGLVMYTIGFPPAGMKSFGVKTEQTFGPSQFPNFGISRIPSTPLMPQPMIIYETKQDKFFKGNLFKSDEKFNLDFGSKKSLDIIVRKTKFTLSYNSEDYFNFNGKRKKAYRNYDIFNY